MKKRRRFLLVPAFVVSLGVVLYAWDWGTREEQEEPDSEMIIEFNRLTDESRRRDRLREQARKTATAAPTPVPTLHPLVGPEVDSINQYLGPRGEVPEWQKVNLVEASKRKAEMARLKDVNTDELVARRYHLSNSLGESLKLERMILIWRGARASDNAARAQYRRRIAEKDKQIENLGEQAMRDRDRLIESGVFRVVPPSLPR